VKIEQGFNLPQARPNRKLFGSWAGAGQLQRGLWFLGALVGGFCVSLGAAQAAPPDPEVDLIGFLDYVVAVACATPAGDALVLAERLGATPTPAEPDRPKDDARRGRTDERFRLPDDGELRILRLAPGGELMALAIELYGLRRDGALQPVAAALAGGDCGIRLGRRIAYGPAGEPEALIELGHDLAETGEREPVDPPVPGAGDPGGVRVALVDSGVNYMLPAIAGRLARGPAGEIVGYDFWAMDARPFDADTSRSPFFPARHGTRVASVLMREAPTLSLVPYRYPRPALGRMADLVEHAAEHGVRVVNMALGSNHREDWQAFAEAAAAHPEMLFVVSAGNDGRNIDERPVYPAALDLDNLIVVTSSDAAGRLAPGSNWGSRHVDLMVPGEQQPVVDFEGRQQTGSGSSFAVPRVAALAARLLARHPGWPIAEVKAAIIALAQPSSHYARQPVRHGWIADPAAAS
jgi:Subtilase family